MAFSIEDDTTQSITVRQSPGKGQGWFATRPISSGTLLLEELPILGVNKIPNPTDTLAPFNLLRIYREFKRLPIRVQESYLLLECPTGDHCFSAKHYITPIANAIRSLAEAGINHSPVDATEASRVAGIFYSNAMDGKDGTREEFFLRSSLFNHSCIPNAARTYNDFNNCVDVRAIRDISADEEVTISYCDVVATLEQRTHLLDEQGFRCTCPACNMTTQFAKDSHWRRKRLVELNKEITALRLKFDGSGVPQLPALYLEWFDLMEDEGLCDPDLATMHQRLARVYGELGQYDKAHDHQSEAICYAINCFGDEEITLVNMRAKQREYLDEAKRRGLAGSRCNSPELRDSPPLGIQGDPGLSTATTKTHAKSPVVADAVDPQLFDEEGTGHSSTAESVDWPLFQPDSMFQPDRP